MNERLKIQLSGDVLIVDDDVCICEILKDYCENMGCFRSILFAHDGWVASRKLGNQKFSLILLDLNMPKKSGFEILKELDDTSLNSKKNVVVVSGAIDRAMAEKLIAMGAKSFLPKPFSQKLFQEKIIKLLANTK